MADTTRKTLVFSVALNQYGQAFRRCIESQERYARDNGHDYLCIEDIGGESDLGVTAAWLKIPLLLGALRTGYSHVVFVDADIEVLPGTRDISAELDRREDHGIFCALGHSGRINSGVMAVRNSPDTVQALCQILSRAGNYLPVKSAVSWWGENGQVIHALTGSPVFGELETYWNNTFDKQLDEGFRHYTGPLRSLYVFDEREQAAWDEVKKLRFGGNKDGAIDRPLFYLELMKAYDLIRDRHAAFAAPSPEWFRAEMVYGAHPTQPRSGYAPKPEPKGLELHFCHEIDPEVEASNQYFAQLFHGLADDIGVGNIRVGAEFFWTGDYSGIDALNIQFAETLCGWEVPTQEILDRIGARLDEIGKTTRIVYTLHNIELNAAFGEMAERLMDVVCQRADVIIHLTQASVTAFRARYRDMPWAEKVPAVVIPHGTYDAYHDIPVHPVAPRKWPRDHIFISGSIRNEAEWTLAQAVTERAEAAGLPVVFAGRVHKSVVDRETQKELMENAPPSVMRNHGRVPTRKMVRLARTARCFFIPRVGRLNSGVWYMAATFGCPAVAPDELSLRELQDQVGGETYTPGDPDAAFAKIRAVYDQSIEERLAIRRRIIDYAKTELDWSRISAQHVAVFDGRIPEAAA